MLKCLVRRNFTESKCKIMQLSYSDLSLALLKRLEIRNAELNESRKASKSVCAKSSSNIEQVNSEENVVENEEEVSDEEKSRVKIASALKVCTDELEKDLFDAIFW